MNPQSTTLYQAFGWPGTVIGAICIVIVTAVICHVLVKLVRRMLDEATDGRVGGSIFANVTRVVIWMCGIGALLFFCFDFNLGVIWGALGIGGIALSLGAQSTITSLIGGFQVSASREVAVGDWVTIGTTTGVVKDITWRKMMVEDSAGNLYNIPNSILTTTTLEVLAPFDIVNVPLVLDSDCDLAAIKEELPGVVKAALKEEGMLYEDHDVRFSITGTEMTGISGMLKCFVSRECFADIVSDVAMKAAVSCLRAHDALPRGLAEGNETSPRSAR